MSREGYFGIALGIAGIIVAIIQMIYPQIPKEIGWSIVGFLILVALILVRKGILVGRKKKQPIEVRPDFSIDWVGGTRDSCWFRKGLAQRAYLPEEEITASSLILDSALVINTPRPILVESLELEIAEKLYPSDWSSQMVLQSMQTDICFDFPLDISRGSRKVRLKAVIDGRAYWFAEGIKELRQALH
jgi:hypothetical protein